MTENKKKKPKLVGAKIASTQRDTFLSPINIEINGEIYSCYGNSRIESIIDSVDSHIENDKEFKDDITIIQSGYINEVIYAPAVLCMLGYIDKGDLYNLLVGNTFEGLTDVTG